MAERRASTCCPCSAGVLALLGAGLALLSQAGRLHVDAPVAARPARAPAGVVGVGAAVLGLRRRLLSEPATAPPPRGGAAPRSAQRSVGEQAADPGVGLPLLARQPAAQDALDREAGLLRDPPGAGVADLASHSTRASPSAPKPHRQTAPTARVVTPAAAGPRRAPVADLGERVLALHPHKPTLASRSPVVASSTANGAPSPLSQSAGAISSTQATASSRVYGDGTRVQRWTSGS